MYIRSYIQIKGCGWLLDHVYITSRSPYPFTISISHLASLRPLPNSPNPTRPTRCSRGRSTICNKSRIVQYLIYFVITLSLSDYITLSDGTIIITIDYYYGHTTYYSKTIINVPSILVKFVYCVGPARPRNRNPFLSQVFGNSVVCLISIHNIHIQPYVSCTCVSMADKMHSREVLTILILCILWYIVSSSNNVVGKMVLNDFPYPMTVTMVQLLSITLYSGPFFNMWGVRRFVDISWSYYFKLILPLALGKFMASIFTHVSIWKVPVSYAHTGEYGSS